MIRKKKNILILTLVIFICIYGVKITRGELGYLGDNMNVLNKNENNYKNEVISKNVMNGNHTFNIIYITLNVERTYNGLLITWPSVNDSQGHQITYRLYYREVNVVGGDEDVWTHIANTTDNNYLWNHNSHEWTKIRVEATCQYGLSGGGITRTSEYTYIPSVKVEITYNGLLITWPSVNDSQGHQITYRLYYREVNVVGGDENVWTHIANTTDNNYLWDSKRWELTVIRVEGTCQYGLSAWGTSHYFINSEADHTLTTPWIYLPINFSTSNGSATLKWNEAIDSYGFPVFYEVHFSGGSDIEWILIETNITRTSFTINITKIFTGEYNDNEPLKISEDVSCLLKVTAKSEGGEIRFYIIDITDEMKVFLTSELGKKLQQEQGITPGWSSIITIFSVVIVIIISRIINIQNRRKKN